nr:MAG TPA: hypothetical protein [Caudoviricetes sp.]
MNFAECVGKDSNKIFFGFDFESFDRTLYDLFMACMDKYPSFALKRFFEKNTN